MAKLKVGDIVIEDGNVSFDGGASPAASVPVPVPASASPPPPAPKPARRDPLEVARGLPGSPRLLVVLGLVALLASMGAIWAARGVLTGENSHAGRHAKGHALAAVQHVDGLGVRHGAGSRVTSAVPSGPKVKTVNRSPLRMRMVLG